jgi:serine/threonine protein phosphatase PrpC
VLGVPPSRSVTSPVQVDVFGVSHVGRVRQNNEDQFFVAKLTRSLETITTTLTADDAPARADEVNYLLIVADGMGGHAAGEVASRMAVSSLVRLALQLPDWIFQLDDDHVPEIEWRARRLVQQVGSMLVQQGAKDPALAGMGTTFTAARSLGRDLMIVHVGDSRAYLYRAGRLRRLTKDHTFAQMMVERGDLGAEDAAQSRLRHILTNALGGSSKTVDVDIDMLRLEDGDRLLLCSDGLTDLVDDEAVAATLSSTPVSRDTCAQLVKLALERGGRDNITAVVAAYTFSGHEE